MDYFLLLVSMFTPLTCFFIFSYINKNYKYSKKKIDCIKITNVKSFNNVIYNKDLKERLRNTFLELIDILSSHAGPFAQNCVIGSKWRQVNDIDEFTKDGIKILRHLLVSEDPVARFAARMTRFVGIAVDNRCHDGTTTAMLMFCNMAISAIDKMDVNNLSTEAYTYSKLIESIIDSCSEFLDTCKITEDDILELCKSEGVDTTLEDVRSSIGYHMALISSKGDHDLSTKISHVIRTTPKKVHGMFMNAPLAVETDERYIFSKQEFDISVKANIGNHNDYNYKNDTQYFSDNAVVYATGNDIVTDSFESAFLMSFISKNPRVRSDLLPMFGVETGWEDICEGKKHLIIMTPLLNDHHLIEAIMYFNKNNPLCKVTWFNTQAAGRIRTSFNKALHYMAGSPLFQDTMMDANKSLIGLNKCVSVHFIGNVLTLSNLYEKDGKTYHPFYNDPTIFPPYNLFVEELEDLIAFAEENIANPNLEQDELTYIMSLYRIILCQEVYDIKIGGSVHDQYSNRTIYEDAIGAAMSAIKEGVVLGGYAHLLRFYNDECRYDDYLFRDSLLSVLKYSLKTSVNDIEDLIETDLVTKWDYLVVNTNDDEYPVDVDTLNKDTLKLFLDNNPDLPILFQAYAGYNEQFKRFKDLLPRLANTSHLADMRIQENDDVR